MRDFFLTVLAGGLFGGLGAYALLPLLTKPLNQQSVGGGTIQLGPELYARDQLLVGVFLASLLGAVISYGMAWGLVTAKRRRRR